MPTTEVLLDESPYAPYGLQSDAAKLGFATTTVASDLGTCVARHLPARTGTRATVFLHGASGAWTTWTPVLAAAGASGIPIAEAVLLDLPGWGDARLDRDPADVTIDSIAELVKRMTDELGYTELDLVGHSLGGFIAMHMAAIWPGLVASVSMVSGTTFSVIHSVEHPVARFRELPAFTMLWRVMQALSTLGAAGTALVRAAGAVGLLRLIFAPLFRHGFRMPRTLILATMRDLRPKAFVAAAGVARGYPADASWSAITCPVRAVKGDRDVFVTDDDLDHLGRILPHSRRTIIAGCGHFANVERPVALLNALGFEPRNLT